MSRRAPGGLEESSRTLRGKYLEGGDQLGAQLLHDPKPQVVLADRAQAVAGRRVELGVAHQVRELHHLLVLERAHLGVGREAQLLDHPAGERGVDAREVLREELGERLLLGLAHQRREQLRVHRVRVVLDRRRRPRHLLRAARVLERERLARRLGAEAEAEARVRRDHGHLAQVAHDVRAVARPRAADQQRDLGAAEAVGVVELLAASMLLSCCISLGPRGLVGSGGLSVQVRVPCRGLESGFSSSIYRIAGGAKFKTWISGASQTVFRKSGQDIECSPALLCSLAQGNRTISGSKAPG